MVNSAKLAAFLAGLRRIPQLVILRACSFWSKRNRKMVNNHLSVTTFLKISPLVRYSLSLFTIGIIISLVIEFANMKGIT